MMFAQKSAKLGPEDEFAARDEDTLSKLRLEGGTGWRVVVTRNFRFKARQIHMQIVLQKSSQCLKQLESEAYQGSYGDCR